MTSTIRIILPFLTLSNNDLLKMHFGSRTRLRKQYTMAVKLLVRDAPRATGKRRLVIERHSHGELDKDNAYGGCKPLIDAIKKLGLVVDDSPKHCELEVVQVKIPRDETPHMVVTIGDLHWPQPAQ